METLPNVGEHVIWDGNSAWVTHVNPAVTDEVAVSRAPNGIDRWVRIDRLEYPKPRVPVAKSPSQVRDRMTTGEAEALCRMVATIADALGIGDDNSTVAMARWNVAELDLWRKG
jgi:hypothetical protein